MAKLLVQLAVLALIASVSWTLGHKRGLKDAPESYAATHLLMAEEAKLEAARLASSTEYNRRWSAEKSCIETSIEDLDLVTYCEETMLEAGWIDPRDEADRYNAIDQDYEEHSYGRRR